MMADNQIDFILYRIFHRIHGHIQCYHRTLDFFPGTADKQARIIPFFRQAVRRKGFHDVDYFTELYRHKRASMV